MKTTMDYSLMKASAPNSMRSPSQSTPFPKMILSGRSRQSSVNSLRKSTMNTPIITRDEMLLKLLLRAPDQPLRPDVEDFAKGEKCLSPMRDENTPPPGTDHQQRPPNSCHRFEGKPLEKGATPEYSEMSSSPKTPIARGDCKAWENYPSMCLVQQELDGGERPDRSRDKSALKDPAKNYFNYYDEQKKTADEKRTTTERPKSIQEVMKDVVVYVEVRTGEDNRSAGVKKVISQLGAKVNDKLLRDTTHVVFKDGLQSTYNKAKKWDIPLVSILWIEECKKQMKLMDPILFPISNIERYENPELYGRFKRMKSMQPDAEEKSRRNKSKTIKETEIEKTANTNSALVVPKKPKDKLDEILYEFQEKLLNTPDGNGGDCLPFESKLLQRIKNSPFTPKSHKEQNKTGSKGTIKGNKFSAVSEQSEDCIDTSQSDTRKALKYNSTERELPNPRLAAGALKPTKSEGDCGASVSVGRRTTRRSSMSTTAVENSLKKTLIKSVRKTTLFTVSEQPNNQIMTSQIKKPASSKNICLSSSSVTKNPRRRTLFTPTTKEELKTVSGGSERTIDSYFSKESGSRRKTIYNPIQTIEETTDSIEEETPTQLNIEVNTAELVDEEKGVSNRRKTSLNLLEEHASTILFSSTKTPQIAKRRTLFDISMDIIDQRLQSINKSAKQNKMRRDSIDSEHSITPLNQLRTLNSIVDSNSQSELTDQTLTEDVNKNEKFLSPEVSEQLPKKRKLFAPVDMTSSPTVLKDFDPMKFAARKRLKKFEEGSSASKKRRTLFEPVPPAEDSPNQQTKTDRRRTMGFDVIRKIAASHRGAKAELAVPFLV